MKKWKSFYNLALYNNKKAEKIFDFFSVEDWCTEKAASVLMFNKLTAAKQGLSYQKHVYSLSK